MNQSTTKGSMKRKNDVRSDQKSKVVKSEGDISVSKNEPSSHATETGKKEPDLESKLEVQTKEIWAIKDDLKKHVTTPELRGMLEVNGQDSSGSELDLRERWYGTSRIFYHVSVTIITLI